MLREFMVGPFSKLTSGLRRGPDFIIVGAERSGTTFLFNSIRHHPQIKLSRRKEVHFFDTVNQEKISLSEYKSYFPLKVFSKGSVVGEATPNYIYTKNAAKNIKKLLPEVKLVFLLRDPTQRAISGYFYRKTKKYNQNTNYPSIQEAYMCPDSELVKNKEVFAGLYAEQIAPFLNYFEKKQLLFIRSEDFFSETEKTFKKLFTFLGINEEIKMPSLSSKNAAQKREVSKDVEERLNRFYERPNKKLACILGDRFVWGRGRVENRFK